MSTSFKKRETQEVPRRNRAVMAKKCTKKRDARAKLLFCQESKPIAFLPLSLPSPSSLLKLPTASKIYVRMHLRITDHRLANNNLKLKKLISLFHKAVTKAELLIFLSANSKM